MRLGKRMTVLGALILGGGGFAAIPEERILDGWLDELISVRRIPQHEIASVIHFGDHAGAEPIVLFVDKLQFVVENPERAAASARDHRALDAFRRMFRPGEEGLVARKSPSTTLSRADPK